MTKQTLRLIHTLLLTLVVMLSTSWAFKQGYFEWIEWQVDDLKTLLIREGTEGHEDVVVLLIDEASLSAMDPVVGRWPWPRSVWGDVLEFMAISGASNVVFDILFTERAGAPGSEPAMHDQHLIEMSEATGLAIHAMQLLHDEHNPHAGRPLPDIFSERFALTQVSGLPASGNDTFYIPFEGLYQAADKMAVVEFSPDPDGTYRRTRLLRDYQGDYYPVLSVAPLVRTLNLESFNQQGNRIFLNNLEVPLDRQGNYRVNFYEEFTTYSMASVLASIDAMQRGDIEALYTNPHLVEPEFFTDKIVYVGASAVGLEDLKDTPVHNRWPGVFLHASITSNLLDGDFLYQVSNQWIYLAIAGLTLITWLALIFGSSLVLQLGIPTLLTLGYLTSSYLLQAHLGWMLDVVPIVISISISWLLVSAYLSATEGRERRRVRNMLSQYVSPAALNTVLDNYKEDQLAAEVGQEVEMSVAFSDVRSFTSICEGLNAAQVVQLLNIHLDAMTRVTFDYQGTMDKFIGDATMAFWGAPLPDENHAYHATLAALNMNLAMSEVNAKITSEGMQPISVGIGVNTGQVILGNIGSEQKLDYTIIGDAVNLGSRMEGLTKTYGVPVLISEFTFAALKDRIPSALIDAVRVKGKQKPVKIYAPLVEPEKEPEKLEWGQQLAKQTEAAFHLYQEKRFTEATKAFALLPDQPFKKYKKVMQDRCAIYLEVPPPANWDGVFTLQNK